MAKPGAISNRRLPHLLCFLTCHVISLCELIFSSYFLWAPWLWRYASGKAQVCLCWVPLMSNQFIHQFPHSWFPHCGNMMRIHTPHLCLAQAWILIFYRCFFLDPNCLLAFMSSLLARLGGESLALLGTQLCLVSLLAPATVGCGLRCLPLLGVKSPALIIHIWLQAPFSSLSALALNSYLFLESGTFPSILPNAAVISRCFIVLYPIFICVGGGSLHVGSDQNSSVQ